MSDERATFYFDLGSPESYLAAEQVLHVLPGPVEWQPVLASELPGSARMDAFRCSREEEIYRAEIARRARRLGLQPVRWPDPFPFDSALAMRAACYAKSIGRIVPFAQAAFRQAFAGGHGLDEADYVLIASAACEMHPAAVLRALELSLLVHELSVATADAARAGVREVPAVLVGGLGFEGEHALEEARARIGTPSPAGPR